MRNSFIVASRGHPYFNRNNRKAKGTGVFVQMLDTCFSTGKTFALTNFCKDNLVLEYDDE